MLKVWVCSCRHQTDCAAEIRAVLMRHNLMGEEKLLFFNLSNCTVRNQSLSPCNNAETDRPGKTLMVSGKLVKKIFFFKSEEALEHFAPQERRFNKKLICCEYEIDWIQTFDLLCMLSASYSRGGKAGFSELIEQIKRNEDKERGINVFVIKLSFIFFMNSTRPHHHSGVVGRFCFHQDASVNNLALQYLLKQVSDTALDLLSLLLLPMLGKKINK